MANWKLELDEFGEFEMIMVDESGLELSRLNTVASTPDEAVSMILAMDEKAEILIAYE